MLQCWKSTTNAPVPILLEDILLDVEPMFQILHYESCEKNQILGGPHGAWCIYLKKVKKIRQAESKMVKNRLSLYNFQDNNGNDYYYDDFNVLKQFIVNGKNNFEKINVWSTIFRLSMINIQQKKESSNKGFKIHYNVLDKLIKMVVVDTNDKKEIENNNNVKGNLIKMALYELENNRSLNGKKDRWMTKKQKRKIKRLLENHLLLLLEEDKEYYL